MSGKNVGDVARGLKGAVNNPNNSDAAKQSAQERLNQLEESGEINSQSAHDGQVLRGHKAAMSNPKNSQEAKEHSKQIIEDLDA